MKSEPRKRVDLALRHVNLSMGRLAKRADNNFDSFPGGNSLMRITKKKIVGAVAVSAVVALGAGSAYAFWTTDGSGTGSASVGDSETLAISGDIADALLLDIEESFTITATNNATFAQTLSTLTFDFTPSNTNCLKSWFTATQPTVSPIDIAANGGTATFTAALELNNVANVNQDACKDNTIALSYTSS